MNDETYAPLSDTGNRPPRVHFEASGHVMTAWTCGNALETVKAFIADGTVKQEPLENCE